MEDSKFRELEDVKAMYGIEEQSDETFISRDKSDASLTEALRQIVGHHLEIAPCNINPLAAFQALFASKDKWDYVEQDTIKDLKSDIVSQHLWQAERYKTLGQLKDAIAELRKALKIVVSRKEKLDILLDLGWLLRSLGQFSAAAKKYEAALRIATEYDNIAWIRQRLAEVYVEMGQPSMALLHYEQVFVDDLYTEDREELQKHIAELNLTISTTPTA